MAAALQLGVATVLTLADLRAGEAQERKQRVRDISVVVRILAALLTFVAVWMAGVEAQELRGWRSILLPAAQVLVVGISVAVAAALLAGTGYTVKALLRQLGLLGAVP